MLEWARAEKLSTSGLVVTLRGRYGSQAQPGPESVGV